MNRISDLGELQKQSDPSKMKPRGDEGAEVPGAGARWPNARGGAGRDVLREAVGEGRLPRVNSVPRAEKRLTSRSESS